MSSPAERLPSTSHPTSPSEPFVPATTQPTFAAANSFHRVGPLRISSPRLFRDFFSSMPDPAPHLQAELPNSSSPSRRDGAFTFADAIGRASQAVATAGEAFAPRAGSSGEEIVDLTDSPPEHPISNTRPPPQADYLSLTTHPSDSRQSTRTSRPLSTLHEPIFGYQPFFTSGPSPDFDDDTIIGARNQRYSRPSPPRFARTSHPRPTLPRLLHTTTRRAVTEQEERDAVRRQRENHAAWQRTQARALELQRRQDTEAQSNSASPQITPEDSPQPSTSSQVIMSTEQIESVDLTEVDDNMPIAEVIARQRAEQIASQMPNNTTESGRTPLTAFKCPICMDELTDATVTICGHLFCHRCLLESLKASATQRQHETGSARKNGLCPVCRKGLAIRDIPGTQRTLIPLTLKVLKAPKRKRDEKGKGRAESEVDERSHSKRTKRESSEELFRALLEAID